jgi:hydrogenase maturation protease
MSAARILIAGIGNIFLGDDGFGVEVVRRLRERSWPEGVQVRDFGIRGLDLAYSLSDVDEAILVDATRRGGTAGTIYVIEPDEAVAATPLIEAHSMDPARVLQTVWALGGRLPRVRIVGCEPLTCGTDDEPAFGLSEPVQGVVDEAVRIVESLVQDTIQASRCV